MINGILGKKIGMSQVFTKEGLRISATVISAGPCTVQLIRSVEKDGYCSVQLGFDDAKESRTKKPQLSYLKTNNLKPKKFVREIRCEADPDIKIGDVVTGRIFQKGDFIDVTGVSKGKGFQGGMKRHNWSGGPATHGSKTHRRPGSIGASAYPSRVFKGHGMPGHMGAEQITVQNVKVLEFNADNNTLVVKGAIPGAAGSYLVIKYALKKPILPREIVEEEQTDEEQEPVVEEAVMETPAPVKEEKKEENKESADVKDKQKDSEQPGKNIKEESKE